MSKAEDRAKERYWLEPSNIETQEKYAAYVEGYHQAEKDLALTWEDIREQVDFHKELLSFYRHTNDSSSEIALAKRFFELGLKLRKD